jgi:uncharacterized protein (DUF1778 family)
MIESTAAPGARLERLEARITPEQKDLFRRAAELSGRTLTDFVVASAREAALRTIEQQAVTTLAASDQRAFVAALLHPPAPGARLRTAWRRYRKRAPR